ncbi:hypothetical protein IJJ12_03100, partial [bacterium]|nr:hypothetical protein [bacterium]
MWTASSPDTVAAETALVSRAPLGAYIKVSAAEYQSSSAVGSSSGSCELCPSTYPNFDNETMTCCDDSDNCIGFQMTCPTGYTWSSNDGDCVAADALCGDHATLNTEVCYCDSGYFTSMYTKSFPLAQAGTYNCNTTAHATVSHACANPIGIMQEWTDCDSLTATNASTTGSTVCLKDARDGQTYFVRKYPDGHCWMAQNLNLGTNCTATSFNSNDTSSASGYVGTYGGVTYQGLCRSPGSAYDGLFYNWEATMNNATAVYNGSYSAHNPQSAFSNGTTPAVHDICPMGWHVPSGGSGGEFQVLADKIQGSSVSNGCASGTCGTAWSFFRTTGANGWNATTKSMIAGLAGSGSLYNQGADSYWWSSTVNSTTLAYAL